MTCYLDKRTKHQDHKQASFEALLFQEKDNYNTSYQSQLHHILRLQYISKQYARSK